MSDLIEHICNHIKLLPEDEMHILHTFRKRTVKKNEFILNAGEVCRHETFISKGCFTMSHLNESGKEEIVLFGSEQWYIADLYSYLSEEPSNFDIKALEDAEVWQISHGQLDTLLRTVPALERYFRILFQNAFVSMQTRLMENLHNTAQERYRKFLKRYPGMHSRLPQYLIASYLGITPQFLSKIRTLDFKQK